MNSGDDKRYLQQVISTCFLVCPELLHTSLCWIEAMNLVLDLAQFSFVLFLFLYDYSTAMKLQSNSSYNCYPFDLLSCFLATQKAAGFHNIPNRQSWQAFPGASPGNKWLPECSDWKKTHDVLQLLSNINTDPRPCAQ